MAAVTVTVRIKVIGGALLLWAVLQGCYLMARLGLWAPEVALCAGMRFAALLVRFRVGKGRWQSAKAAV